MQEALDTKEAHYTNKSNSVAQNFQLCLHDLIFPFKFHEAITHVV